MAYFGVYLRYSEVVILKNCLQHKAVKVTVTARAARQKAHSVLQVCRLCSTAPYLMFLLAEKSLCCNIFGAGLSP